MKTLFRRYFPGSTAADALVLRLRWGDDAAAEARRRIEAEAARTSLRGMRHWTSVWFELMRVSRVEPGFAH